VLDRLTAQAREVVVLASDEARTLRHAYLGTEHLLLGLARQEHSVASAVLAANQVTVQRARAQVERLIGRGNSEPPGQLPLTAPSKQVLDAAALQARALGSDRVTPEHLLLGLTQEPATVAARILADLGVELGKVHVEISRALEPPEIRRDQTLMAIPAPLEPDHPAALARTNGRPADPEPASGPADEAAGLEVRVTPSAPLRSLLMSAAARALDDDREEMDGADLLLALIADPVAGPVLAELGVLEAAVRAAIARRRGRL
jgi:hypothetical protein